MEGEAVTDVIALGLVCWLATTIIVESELVRPLRDFVERKRWAVRDIPEPVDYVDASVTAMRFFKSKQGPEYFRRERPLVTKLSYALSCHLCTGTWVGVSLALIFGSPFSGAVGILGGGLLYKAIGHLVLELRPQAWLAIVKAKCVGKTTQW